MIGCGLQGGRHASAIGNRGEPYNVENPVGTAGSGRVGIDGNDWRLEDREALDVEPLPEGGDMRSTCPG